MHTAEIAPQLSLRDRLGQVGAVLGVMAVGALAGGSPVVEPAASAERVAQAKPAPIYRGELHIGSAVSGVADTINGSIVEVYDARRAQR